ncbi:MAG TPA: tetratricopeptide repeat protein [Tepidisphaeraceae bacterium]
MSLAAFAAGCNTSRPVPPQQQPINRYVKGYQAYQRGEAELAKAELEAAVAANPDLRMARTLLGEIYRKQKDYGAAARQYEVLSRSDPYTLDNHYYLGVSYQFLQRYRASIAAYLTGLKLQANDFKSNMALGTVYLALGETGEAVNYLDKATQIDPSSGVAWSNLGVALDAKGSLVLAETSYRKAMEREPNSGAIQQNLANNLLAQKKTGESIYFWQQLIKTQPTPFRRARLAEAYVQSGDFGKAEREVDELLAEDANFVAGHNARAASKIRQYELSGFGNDKFRTEAVAALRKSLSLNGNQPAIEKQLREYESASAIKP